MFPSVSQGLIILLIIVLVFGASRLPKISEDLAKSIKAFKHGLSDESKEESKKLEDRTEK